MILVEPGIGQVSCFYRQNSAQCSHRESNSWMLRWSSVFNISAICAELWNEKIAYCRIVWAAQYNAFLTGILLWNLKEFHCHQLFPILISEIFRIIKYWLYYILGWLKTVNSEKIRRFYTFRSQWSFDECYSNSYSFPNITTFATFQVLLTGSNNQFRNYESEFSRIFDKLGQSDTFYMSFWYLCLVLFFL